MPRVRRSLELREDIEKLHPTIHGAAYFPLRRYAEGLRLRRVPMALEVTDEFKLRCALLHDPQINVVEVFKEAPASENVSVCTSPSQ